MPPQCCAIVQDLRNDLAFVGIAVELRLDNVQPALVVGRQDVNRPALGRILARQNHEASPVSNLVDGECLRVVAEIPLKVVLFVERAAFHFVSLVTVLRNDDCHALPPARDLRREYMLVPQSTQGS